MTKLSARDRILDAYEAILTEHGPASVTLEAVAARAEVSKGGLLYHFGSKDALLDGLLDRLKQLGEQDVARARTAPEGFVRYYLRSSATDATPDHPLHRTTMATIRLLGHEPRVADCLRACMLRWRTALAEYIDDPLDAELVGLIGDGLYMRGSMGESDESGPSNVDKWLKRLGL